MKRALFEDEFGPRTWVIFAAPVLVIGVLIAIIIGVSMLISSSACDQRAASRPDIPMEWHWNTGCILLRPDATVVVSS